MKHCPLIDMNLEVGAKWAVCCVCRPRVRWSSSTCILRSSRSMSDSSRTLVSRSSGVCCTTLVARRRCMDLLMLLMRWWAAASSCMNTSTNAVFESYFCLVEEWDCSCCCVQIFMLINSVDMTLLSVCVIPITHADSRVTLQVKFLTRLGELMWPDT